VNRQTAFAYAIAGVAASVAAIVSIGSAFGFGGNAATEPPADLPAAVAQAAAQLPPDQLQQLLAQREVAQAAVAAEIDAQRSTAIAEVEQQIAQMQQQAAADLQLWIDQQQQLTLDAVATPTPSPMVANWYDDDDDHEEREYQSGHEEHEDHEEWDDD
jgi:hypothetical protein